MNLNPAHDRVIVRLKPRTDKTTGGIYIPPSADSGQSVETGVVVAVGRGRLNEHLERIPMLAEVGMEVLFGKYSGSGVSIDDDDSSYVIIRDGDIVAVVSDK